MGDKTFRDNDLSNAVAPPGERDAPAQAAILLVESLIHGLVARSVLSVEEAIEIVKVASEVVGEIEENEGGASPMSRKSASILDAIHASLAIDRASP